MIKNTKEIKKVAEQYLGNAEALQSPTLADEMREDVKKINVSDISREIREIHDLIENVIYNKLLSDKPEANLGYVYLSKGETDDQDLWNADLSLL
ncbi:MAG: hypothetical protein K6A69_09025 [Lachnospiraceae bacterium]|nr:hypothetical protein [Lachnospiraceae bacterium]